MGTGTVDGVADGVGADGLGLGADVVLDVGVGADGLGSGVVDGLGDADGAGVGVTGVDVDGLGVGVGLGDADGVGTGVGVGVGTTGLVSNPALPPDSFLVTRALTSQDLSWEVIVAESSHGPGSVGSTSTFN